MESVYQSTQEIGHLTEALAAASAEFAEVVKGSENPYYGSKYADLSSLIGATRAALGKNGIAVLQIPVVNRDENSVTLTTILSHKSNERIVTAITFPMAKPDAQGIGSAITYARRYSLQSILNIAGEEDDDGNAAVGKTQNERRSKSSDNGDGLCNPVQQRAFIAACKTGGRTDTQTNQYFAVLGIRNIEELAKVDFDMAIKWALNRQQNLEQQIGQSAELAKEAKKRANGKPQAVVAAMDQVDKDEQVAGD